MSVLLARDLGASGYKSQGEYFLAESHATAEVWLYFQWVRDVKFEFVQLRKFVGSTLT